MKKRSNIAVIGLRFGGSFPLIYRDHPDVGSVAVCDSDEATLTSYADRYGITERFRDVRDVLASDDIDAVHIVTGIPNHAELSLAVLNAGKHCACTVPMATSISDMKEIVKAERRNRRNYMMMETAVYTYQFLFARDMHARGEFGRIQLLRGAHYQDMEHWPPYWMGLPPLWYATHAVAPLLALECVRATKVHCFGTGVMRDELTTQYGNPFPAETALFRLSNGIAAEVTRSLFQTAHEYLECFHVYGEKHSFEWHTEHEMPLVTTMKPSSGGKRGNEIVCERVEPKDKRELLPEAIRTYTEVHIIPDPKNPHQSIKQGGGHHGSHPHLVHEFIRSIVEERPSAIDSVTAANWSAAGVCAHESAMNDGRGVTVPDFS
ncbi:MAG: Gfo/Idh/MocA family oxidoreductase [Spirochaetota bacterium]